MAKVGGIDIQKPTDAASTLSILVYGESGVGKTVLAASASVVEEMSPVLFIDFEAGVLPLREYYPNVDVIRVTSWKEMQSVYQSFRKGEVNYKTVVLDSLTELQKFSMNTIMQKVVKEDEERDPDIPSMREYGKNLEQMRRIVRLFRDLPINSIFVAHATQETYGKAERSRTKVSLTGKLANEVAGFMDIVLYMYVKTENKEEVRKVLTAQREDVIAKDRTTYLPKAISKPTMQDIYSYCFNKAASDTDTKDEESELASLAEK